jgi:hypothetical protein
MYIPPKRIEHRVASHQLGLLNSLGKNPSLVYTCVDNEVGMWEVGHKLGMWEVWNKGGGYIVSSYFKIHAKHDNETIY